MTPSDLPKLGTRELDALAEISTFGAQLYWRRQASMRKLAAHGLVELHPRNTGEGREVAWRITDAGIALYSGAAP